MMYAITKNTHTAVYLLSVFILSCGMSGICLAADWEVSDPPTGEDYETATPVYQEDESWYAGWGLRALSCVGTKGVYGLSAAGYADPGIAGWYNEDTGTDTSDGYRKRTLKYIGCGTPGTTSVTWEVDGSVQITGHFCADNQMTWPDPDGDCYFYGWAKEIVSGLGSGQCETLGTFSAEEGDDTIAVGAGKVNVRFPIDFENDEGDLNGDDTVSVGTTVPNAGDGDFIKLRGTVTGRAKSHDGAQEASGYVQTKCQTFSLTLN
jgi:hypothetical protein